MVAVDHRFPATKRGGGDERPGWWLKQKDIFRVSRCSIFLLVEIAFLLLKNDVTKRDFWGCFLMGLLLNLLDLVCSKFVKSVKGAIFLDYIRPRAHWGCFRFWPLDELTVRPWRHGSITLIFGQHPVSSCILTCYSLPDPYMAPCVEGYSFFLADVMFVFRLKGCTCLLRNRNSLMQLSSLKPCCFVVISN